MLGNTGIDKRPVPIGCARGKEELAESEVGCRSKHNDRWNHFLA